MSVTLAQMQQRLGGERRGDASIEGVCLDSRQTAMGVAFFACRGATPTSADGHNYIDQAVARGASAVVGERFAEPLAVPSLLVEDSRRALALAAEQVAGDPSRALRLIGITGTNGKSTVVHLLSAALAACGLPCARLGTIGVEGPGLSEQWAFTTPEAPQISTALARLRGAGVLAAALEVSSHGLALQRVDGLHFTAVAFTNLSQDHLDFHADMSDYLAAKTRLFTELATATGCPALICCDDEAGRSIAARLGERALRVCSSPDATAWVSAQDVSLSRDSTRIRARIDGQQHDFVVPFVGSFNVQNVLLTLGVVAALKLDLDAAIQGLQSCAGVPGRMERVDNTAGLRIFVDYSHTPEALRRALLTLRELCEGELLVVFGCGGERDAGKRPIMGRIAVELADRVWITDDNPRNEDGQAIVEAIAEGAQAVASGRAQSVEIERDRAQAIAAAVEQADPADLILIAGKGHEAYQIVGDQRHPFDDRVQARAAAVRRAP